MFRGNIYHKQQKSKTDDGFCCFFACFFYCKLNQKTSGSLEEHERSIIYLDRAYRTTYSRKSRESIFKKPEKMYPYRLKSRRTSAIVSDEHFNVHVAIVQMQGIGSFFQANLR